MNDPAPEQDTRPNQNAQNTGDTQNKGEKGTAEAYRVLARKYRPSRFDELIGQESLVRTLSNALEMGRLAHAFVLTGLRGIGKTTTARIIAKGLNCTGADGHGEPTLSPCGVCSSCTGIADGRHVDVIEMDAASNTGVDDVREIIDGVGYRPLSARYKIYIIDEVHMLSKNAFNALLKTLEEPPEAVKFIFATTEIRKVPVTVLSRCQRFDLRRVPMDMMVKHLASICGKEAITADEQALARIARAAEGSVRDALSMLDQAAALTADTITDAAVASILGQAGRQEALAITRHALAGETPSALEVMAAATGRGAEPQMVLRDMLDLLHLAARVAAGGGLGDAPEGEAESLKSMAATHGVTRLARAWQITLKGHGELALAPDQAAAAEMVVIRLAHASTLPPPSDIIRKLEGKPPSSAAPTIAPTTTPTTSPASTPVSTSEASAMTDMPPSQQQEEAVAQPQSVLQSAPQPQPQPQPQPEPEPEPATLAEPAPEPILAPEPVAETVPVPESLSQLASLFEDQGEPLLAALIRERVRPVVLEPGRLEFAPNGRIEPNVTQEIAQCLTQWTGLRWGVAFSDAEGGQTLAEIDAEKKATAIASVSTHPLVAATLEAFPGASVSEIRPVEAESAPDDNADENTPDNPVDDTASGDDDHPLKAMEG